MFEEAAEKSSVEEITTQKVADKVTFKSVKQRPQSVSVRSRKSSRSANMKRRLPFKRNDSFKEKAWKIFCDAKQAPIDREAVNDKIDKVKEVFDDRDNLDRIAKNCDDSLLF